MSFIKTLIIIGLIIGLVYYVSPTTFDKGVDFAQSFIKSDATKNVVDKVKQSVVDEVIVNESSSINISTTVDMSDEVVDEPISYEDDNTTMSGVCAWANGGLPDYQGTTKEGFGCDNNYLNPDWECITSPPTNYEGLINIVDRTSNPLIRCCLDDGNCRWN